MAQHYSLPARPPEPYEQKPVSNLLELLDRILDKGVVVIGDVKVSVADIELLKIQIRLLIASVDKAKELGIDFSWARGLEPSKKPRMSTRRDSAAFERVSRKRLGPAH